MDSPVEQFVEAFLAHYASEYYDPVKAREYYLRTRELKGRRAGLKTEKKKQAWDYASNQLKVAEKGEAEAAAETRRIFVEQARATAQAKRKELSEKLSTLLQAISDNQRRESEAITEDRKKQMEDLAAKEKRELERISRREKSRVKALPAIPKGISEEQRNRLLERRSRQLSAIRGSSDNARRTVRATTKEQRELLSDKSEDQRDVLTETSRQRRGDERETVAGQREAVRTELKAVVDKARADYGALKDALKAKYEKRAQQEYEAIKTKV